MSGFATEVSAVLFDLDGTLLDSAPDLASAANSMRQARGLPAISPELYRPHSSSGARGMLKVAFGVTPADEQFDGLKREFFEVYQGCLAEQTRPFAGVDRLIAGLTSASLPWGVVTNKAERFTGPVMRAMSSLAGAGTVVSGDTTPYAKPHPEPLLEAARRLGRSAHSCIYVGDDLRDIQAGRAAGMQTVAVLYGYLGEGADVPAWGADHVISMPEDLLNLLGLP